jgi:Flp pilus assembly pilin Flp
MKQSIQNQRGQSLVEYLVIVSLVGISSIAIMRAVGNNVSSQFAQVAKALGGNVEGDAKAEKISNNMYKKKDLKNFFQGAAERKDSSAGTGGSAGD